MGKTMLSVLFGLGMIVAGASAAYALQAGGVERARAGRRLVRRVPRRRAQRRSVQHDADGQGLVRRLPPRRLRLQEPQGRPRDPAQ